MEQENKDKSISKPKMPEKELQKLKEVLRRKYRNKRLKKLLSPVGKDEKKLDSNREQAEKLKTIAWEINELLTDYITIHNKILKKAGTFSNLFRRVNFKELYDDSERVFMNFNCKQQEIKKLKAEIYNDLTHDQKEFFDCLCEYVKGLTKTTYLFNNNISLLYSRSQNKIKLKYKDFNVLPV